jgi:uncharacterized membrane protein
MLRKILLLIAGIVIVLAAAIWYDYSCEIGAALNKLRPTEP